MYPPLQGPKDSIAPALKTLLRKPLPAQAMTITGAVKYLKTANSVRIVGECGTGKTLMSVGIAHAHAEARPYNALAMCPPHLYGASLCRRAAVRPATRSLHDLRGFDSVDLDTRRGRIDVILGEQVS